MLYLRRVNRSHPPALVDQTRDCVWRSRRRFTLSLTTTVTLAPAVAAMVLTKNPLQSSPCRPVQARECPNDRRLKVPARLWEDPFAAVEKSREAQKQIVVQVVTDGAKVGAVSATVADQPQGDDGMPSLKAKVEASDGPILALIVMTQGDSSIEGSEARMRDRYAVGAALEVGCYSPGQGRVAVLFCLEFPSVGTSQNIRALESN